MLPDSTIKLYCTQASPTSVQLQVCMESSPTLEAEHAVLTHKMLSMCCKLVLTKQRGSQLKDR